MLGVSGNKLKIDRVLSARPGMSYQDMLDASADYTAEITDEKGAVVFSLAGIKAPKWWSQQAINIVASKYFYRGEGHVEDSVYDLVDRVVDTIVASAVEQGYFSKDTDDVEIFEDELKVILLEQRAAFNSPVWFNVGIHAKPQCSACFINKVEDSMESITDLAKTEMLLFKFGSGTGTNFSTLRSSREWSRKGGFKSSGPVSFMKGFDAFAGVIKSGGKTRRAAKMVILNDDHPDVMDFITCKTTEEKKAHALIREGYSAEFNKPGGAYDSIGYQNANHSVRVSDEFMIKVEKGLDHALKGVLDGATIETVPARMIWRAMAESTWACGDPGVQYDGAINEMHTCKSTDRINASNPCSEYMFLDDSACNLASINLLRFFNEPVAGSSSHTGPLDFFDKEGYLQTISVLTAAMDVIVDMSSYPTKEITKNSHDYRPLGLGYANLGAVFMVHGIPYDSKLACDLTNYLTSLLSGQGYLTSTALAQVKGPFKGYEKNAISMLEVLQKHLEGYFYQVANSDGRVLGRQRSLFPGGDASLWNEVIAEAKKYGVRNAQISVIAPTGTIAFMMDCATTGIEPDLGLVKYKKLVGGGGMKIVNTTVERSLRYMGVVGVDAVKIMSAIALGENYDELLSRNGVDAAVFDCANPSPGNPRFIRWQAHLNIMAAAQPFVSGAISKTVNMPENSTVEDIEAAYMLAWKLKLKAVAVYRDNCKKSQPISNQKEEVKAVVNVEIRSRRKLPTDRNALAHKFDIAGHKGYLHVGLYEDGTPGELFVTIAKEGSTVSGLLDTIATLTSLSLQHGVPLASLVAKFRGQKFEPSGFTKNDDIRIASSVVDYIFRWLEIKFLKVAEEKTSSEILKEIVNSPSAARSLFEVIEFPHTDAPPCPNCGAITQRAGSCYSCPNCGASTGCA